MDKDILIFIFGCLFPFLIYLLIYFLYFFSSWLFNIKEFVEFKKNKKELERGNK